MLGRGIHAGFHTVKLILDPLMVGLPPRSPESIPKAKDQPMLDTSSSRSRAHNTERFSGSSERFDTTETTSRPQETAEQRRRSAQTCKLHRCRCTLEARLLPRRLDSRAIQQAIKRHRLRHLFSTCSVSCLIGATTSPPWLKKCVRVPSNHGHVCFDCTKTAAQRG